MAKMDLGSKLFSGLIYGIAGFILGTVFTYTDIFPYLSWEYIGLFLGIIFGAFKDSLE